MQARSPFPWPFMVLLAGCLGDPEPLHDIGSDTGVPETTTDTGTETTTDTGAPTDTETAAPTDTGVETEVVTDTDTSEVVDPLPGPWDLDAQGLTGSSEPWVIGNDHFGVTLSAQTGWQPSSLISKDGSGEELVYGMPTGVTEAWVGVSLYDYFHVWSDGFVPIVRVAGPALLQVRKTWSIDSGLQGTTVITIHADGRIYLGYDLIVPADHEGSLVAYTTLVIERFSHAQAGASVMTGLPSGQTPIGGYTFFATQLDDADYLCAYHAASRDAVGFVRRPVPQFLTPLPRMTESALGATNPHSIRLQYDFQRNNVVAGTYVGRFMLVVDGTAQCNHIAALATAFRAPAALTMSIGTRVLNGQGDSDGDGFNELGGYYAVDAGDGLREVRLAAAVDAPSASFRVHGAHWAPPSASVNDQALTAGVDFVTQGSADDDGGWVVLVKAIARGDVLHITW